MEKIFQILEKDCSEFLGEMKDSESILFRGVKGEINEIVKGLGKKQSRVNRYALDMRQDQKSLIIYFLISLDFL